MTIESMNCPKCGAPLSLLTNQKLVICVYCNSSLRISLEDPLHAIVSQLPEISPEVIDEVKRLLVGGYSIKAVEYYRQQSGLEYSDTSSAVSALKKVIGYQPPLNTIGILILIAWLLLGIAGVVGGIVLLVNQQFLTAIILIMVAVFLALVNWLSLNSSLKAYLLSHRGIPAEATILKCWQVKLIPVKGEESPTALLRLLLEIHPSEQPIYQTEANCLVSTLAASKFQVGSIIRVKFDVRNPKKIVIVAAAEK